MGLCAIGVLSFAVLAIVGWGLALSYRRRAIRYRAAFDRVFGIARRAYDFSDDETSELRRMIGEPIEHLPSGTDR